MLSRHSARTDLSQNVIHFTKGTQDLGPFDMLLHILKERKLRGSGVLVKGGIACVSFTETPLPVLAEGLERARAGTRYSPFGISFSKKHIFRLGGRPVIYQPTAEYELLPFELRWRHVRFEPEANPPIDWTWEREWRIPCAELPFAPGEVEVVVPDEQAAADLKKRIEAHSYQEAYGWTLVLGDIAWGYYEQSPWKATRLKRNE